MEEQFIRDRITELRLQKDVAERKMSIELGHSTSYIHSIASGRALPSMTEFLYICDYFNITPMEFFNDTEHTSAQQQRAIQYTGQNKVLKKQTDKAWPDSGRFIQSVLISAVPGSRLL